MRCEGWTRIGGVFAFGVPKWTQCENDAVLFLTVEQEKTERLPSCLRCHKEANERGIKVLRIEPLLVTEKT